MDDPLAIYLRDHLAGAEFAVGLLDDLKKQASDDTIASFSARLLEEVQADRLVLQQLVKQIGCESSAVKELAAWFAQKASRFKLRVSDPFGTFEAIEALSLGVQGKIALWSALQAVRERDDRLNGFDFAELASRAQLQFTQLEQVRLRLWRTLFERAHQVETRPSN